MSSDISENASTGGPLQAFHAAGGQTRGEEAELATAALETNASSLWRIVLRDPALLDDALAEPIWRAERPETLARVLMPAQKANDPTSLRRHLRRGRHRSILRIALRELLRVADIDDTSAEIAQLAGAVVDVALAACRRQVEERTGRVFASDGSPVPLVALGMGKLGGGELNLGSDIDLSFFYGDDEGTCANPSGGGGQTVYQVISEIVTQTTRAIADVTEDGFAFRVDLRLRPEGTRGPIASSLDRALRYYEGWGRPWERAALLRARPIAGDLELGRTLLHALEPFVYRRSVDPSIAAEMRRMLEASRREARDEPEDDVKIGRGGIREAEFFVQSLQLIWGGRFPELRVSSTVEAIRRLVGLGHLSARDGDALESDWALLRRVEHRLHLQAGYQTHTMPEDGEPRDILARSLGFESATALNKAVDDARQRVSALFDSLETEPPPPSSALSDLADAAANESSDEALREQIARALPVHDPDAAVAHLRRLATRANSLLGPATRHRYPTLGPKLLGEIASTVDPDAALRYAADFFARLGGGWGFERMLVDHPRRARRLVGLLGASSTLATSLVAHPDWMANLVSATVSLDERSIRGAHEKIEPADPEDMARQLRQLKAETTLRVGLAWVGEEVDLEAVQRYLTVLAESQIATALRLACVEATDSDALSRAEASRLADAMVVLGLGKLGGSEMGFGSDLDVVFIYDREAAASEPDDSGPEQFTRIAQRTLRLLSQPDAEGPGYEIDTRLRPSGSKGMLVVSTEAFARYHAKQAAAWERLALVKARPLTGSDAVRQRVISLTERAAYDGGPLDGLNISRIRERIERELAGEGPRHYHAKIGFGALLDVEFVVQFHQLRQRDAALRIQNTASALRALGKAGVLSEAVCESLRSAQAFFRQVEQAVRFHDERAEPRLGIGTRQWDQVVRALGVRDRDGMLASEVLADTWQRHASETRATFEEHIGPLGTVAPWTRRGAAR